MGADDREEDARCIKVPIELVAELIDVMVSTMARWHAENSVEVEPEICDAAILVASKILTEQYNGIPPNSGMLQ